MGWALVDVPSSTGWNWEVSLFNTRPNGAGWFFGKGATFGWWKQDPQGSLFTHGVCDRMNDISLVEPMKLPWFASARCLPPAPTPTTVKNHAKKEVPEHPLTINGIQDRRQRLCEGERAKASKGSGIELPHEKHQQRLKNPTDCPHLRYCRVWSTVEPLLGSRVTRRDHSICPSPSNGETVRLSRTRDHPAPDDGSDRVSRSWPRPNWRLYRGSVWQEGGSHSTVFCCVLSWEPRFQRMRELHFQYVFLGSVTVCPRNL